MADVLDPVLESILRTTLREEADSIPFRLRAEDVRPSTARTGGPGWRPILLVAAVALVGLSVGGVLLAGAFQPVLRVEPSPAPAAVSGALAGLASYDRLEGTTSVPFDRVIGRAEGLEPADATTILRADEAMPWIDVVLACAGPGLSLESVADGPTVSPLAQPLSPIVCDGGILGTPVVWTTPDTEHGLVINARAGTAWRAVITGRPVDVPERAASTSPIPGLFSFERLLTFRFGLGPELARGSGVGDAAGTSLMMPASPSSPATLVLQCDKGESEVALGTSDSVDAGFGFGILACDPQEPVSIDLPGADRGVEYTTLRIRVQPGASWEAVLTRRVEASPSPTP